MRWFYLGLILLASGPVARATDENALLRVVANRWFAERGRWAFTERVIEYQGRTVRQERVERYDPSHREASQWLLLSIDGHRPTPTQWAEWIEHKNKHRHKHPPGIDSYFDFANARVIDRTPQAVRYELPLRNSTEWLFPINKVDLLVTIDKHPPALAQVQARISEPFRVVLGLARVLHIDLDFQMEAPAMPDPADAKPSGSAHAIVTKLGDRVEYFWTDFQRVTPHAASDP